MTQELELEKKSKRPLVIKLIVLGALVALVRFVVKNYNSDLKVDKLWED